MYYESQVSQTLNTGEKDLVQQKCGQLKIFCCLVIFLAACASPGDLMQSWVGRTKADLIAAWGAPVHVEPDGKGGEILTFRKRVFPSQGPVYMNNSIGGGYTYVVNQEAANQRLRQFLVDQNGTIYSWRWSE